MLIIFNYSYSYVHSDVRYVVVLLVHICTCSQKSQFAGVIKIEDGEEKQNDYKSLN